MACGVCCRTSKGETKFGSKKVKPVGVYPRSGRLRELRALPAISDRWLRGKHSALSRFVPAWLPGCLPACLLDLHISELPRYEEIKLSVEESRARVRVRRLIGGGLPSDPECKFRLGTRKRLGGFDGVAALVSLRMMLFFIVLFLSSFLRSTFARMLVIVGICIVFFCCC